MGSKGGATNGRAELSNGHRSPDVSFKLGTPVPMEVDTPGARDYDSQRQSRNSMTTPGDKQGNDVYKGRFTGKSTLKNPAKNPFGYVKTHNFLHQSEYSLA